MQDHGTRQSSIRALCCLLLHLVMKTEIPSGFEQGGTRASSVRSPGVVGRFPSENIKSTQRAALRETSGNDLSGTGRFTPL